MWYNSCMICSPLSLSRRHVLGELYTRCGPIEKVPVFIDSEEIGYVDEGLGHYADAFQFHIPEDACKKLASGHYTYSFECDYAETEGRNPGETRKLQLKSVVLTARKGYAKPVPRRASGEAKVKAAEA